jgi:UDP-N-acetylmuramate dehydrogenase
MEARAASLAPLTTFHIGGPARTLVTALTEQDVQTALSLAGESGLPFRVLGGGSNVLVPDAGVDAVVIHMRINGVSVTETDDAVRIIAGAGTSWDDVVDAAISRGASGIENLAGIPGTLGGAAVQNIGAYGAEFSAVFEYADCIDSSTVQSRRISFAEASFAYRTSYFKTHRELIITRVGLRLSKEAKPNLQYADLAREQAAGTPLSTPYDVARAVRRIRGGKFPQTEEEGTAGSFFKNPIVHRALADELIAQYPGLPAYPQPDGSVKLSLAWLLDHALSLKGYEQGNVRLYEKQPIVVVARAGASAAAIDAFADDIASRVYAATGISIEREVETFNAA